MKTKLLLTSALIILNSTLFINNLQATVLTISNDGAGGAQYATLQAGYNAAVNGDTLLMEGTNITYTLGNNWLKQLTVIGIGTNPNKSNPRLTKFNYTSSFAAAGNGTTFHGICFITSGISLAASVSNYSFYDCSFAASAVLNLGSTNMTFTNCVFEPQNGINVTLSTVQSINMVFQSCIFNGWIDGGNGASSTITVDHCLFMSTSASMFDKMQNANVTNCINMNSTSIASATCINNTFSNCIFRLSSVLPVNNTGTNNQFNTNPNFTTYTLGTTYTANATTNLHLQAGSPAIGTGTGGTDIGIHGSNTHFNETGEVLINPIVRTLLINNINVAPNGNMNININATKPNDN